MNQIEYGDKLYIIVRSDLEKGAQMAQALHAALHFAGDNIDLVNNWMDKSDYICALGVADETQLHHLLKKAREKGIISAAFYEPDLNNSLTAICLEPGKRSKNLCKGLKLALSENK